MQPQIDKHFHIGSSAINCIFFNGMPFKSEKGCTCDAISQSKFSLKRLINVLIVLVYLDHLNRVLHNLLLLPLRNGFILFSYFIQTLSRLIITRKEESLGNLLILKGSSQDILTFAITFITAIFFCKQPWLV